MSISSEINVINMALADIGESQISSLTEGTDASDTAALIYPATRDEVLRQAWWVFARRFATLNVITGVAPLFGFTTAFALPSDFIRMVSPEGDIPYQLYNTGSQVALAADADAVDIEYIARITDTTRWDELFVQTIVARLASKFALAISHSQAWHDRKFAEYLDLRTDARAINGHDENNPRFIESNVLIDVRGTSRKRPDKVWPTGTG